MDNELANGLPETFIASKNTLAPSWSSSHTSTPSPAFIAVLALFPTLTLAISHSLSLAPIFGLGKYTYGKELGS